METNVLEITTLKDFYVITNWKKESVKSMLEVSSNVSQKMDGNENFPDPAVPLDTFDKKFDRLQLAWNNRENGKMAKLELDAAGDDMNTTLRVQARYVTQASGGDNIIIQSSGFTPSKSGFTPSTIPSMPTDVRMDSSNSNVCLIAKKPKGATSFCWVVYYGDFTDTVKVEGNSIRVPAGVDAQIISPGRAREVLKALQPGLKVSAQVLAQNSAGRSALSDMVSIFVNR